MRKFHNKICNRKEMTSVWRLSASVELALQPRNQTATNSASQDIWQIIFDHSKSFFTSLFHMTYNWKKKLFMYGYFWKGSSIFIEIVPYSEKGTWIVLSRRSLCSSDNFENHISNQSISFIFKSTGVCFLLISSLQVKWLSGFSESHVGWCRYIYVVEKD